MRHFAAERFCRADYFAVYIITHSVPSSSRFYLNSAAWRTLPRRFALLSFLSFSILQLLHYYIRVARRAIIGGCRPPSTFSEFSANYHVARSPFSHFYIVSRTVSSSPVSLPRFSAPLTRARCFSCSVSPLLYADVNIIKLSRLYYYGVTFLSLPLFLPLLLSSSSSLSSSSVSSNLRSLKYLLRSFLPLPTAPLARAPCLYVASLRDVAELCNFIVNSVAVQFSIAPSASY